MWALDRHIRRLAGELGARDLEMGDAARALFQSNGWRRLGYASEWQYVRERAGVSMSSLERRMTLSRRAGRLPEVGAALRTGRIGYEAARRVARVERPETVHAWLDRAEMRTFNHLRKDVEAMELLARANGDRGPLAPPDDETMEAVADVERFVLRMALGDDLPEMSGGADEGDEAAPEMSGGAADRDGSPLRPGAGRVSLRLRLRDDLWTFWRVLRRLHARSGMPGPFVAFLCAAVWRSWRGACEAGRAYREPLLRDRFRCACPVCGRRDTTPHHVVFRSRGGGDESIDRACGPRVSEGFSSGSARRAAPKARPEPCQEAWRSGRGWSRRRKSPVAQREHGCSVLEDENIVALCSACHLDGVHGGVMQVDGKAPELTWRVGREGALVVRGRDVVRRAA